MSSTYPVISFAPADADFYIRGKEEEELCIELQIEKIKNSAAIGNRLIAGSPILLESSDATVGQALDAYEDYIRETMLVMPDLEEGLDGKRLSDTATSYIDDLDRLRTHNKQQMDWPLSRLTIQGCDEILQVWRDRPMKKKGDGQMAVKTCREHGKRLMSFFRWLSKSDDFKWTKPIDFDELKLKIKRTSREKAAALTSLQVKPFTEDELRILNEYATPFERFLLLCGLNLGFKRMECATLRFGEIVLNQFHDHAKYIDFPLAASDSFVRRLRTKTEVYGEWILWPLTVEAMKWILARRKKQTHIVKGDGAGRPIPLGKESLVLLNDNGHALTKPTKGGNPNHQITNMWTRLLKRVRKDHPTFPRLPHEALRDTAANWIRHKFGGEIADTYLAHGSPLGANSLIECYTNRPWGNVFEAIRWLEATKLAPMFKATPANPFPDERVLGGGGLTLKTKKLIRELSASGAPVAEVADQVGCSKMSVYRHKAG
jgi:integrase